MSKKGLSKFVLFCISIILLNNYVYSQETSIEITGLRDGENEYEAFRISRDSELRLEISGARKSTRGEFFTNVWILDAKTRDLVWEISDIERRNIYNKYQRRRNNYTLFTVEIPLRLKKGDYELHYSYLESGIVITGLNDVLDRIFRNRSSKLSSTDLRKLGVKVTGKTNQLIPQGKNGLVQELIKNAIVSINKAGNNYNEKIGFKLNKATRVKIYCIGEAYSDENYDYGSIIDARTHRKVWEFDPSFADYAGGAEKNKLGEDYINLPAGEYYVYYSTDNSHSYNNWNEAPPYDPIFWGITIFAEDEKFSKIHVEPITRIEELETIVELTRIGDDENVSRGFSLNRDMDVRILALGEEGYDDYLVDYAWIIDADTRELIWRMNLRDTFHAGGGSKNRLFDRTIRLKKGNYIVYYSSDGSHSYEDFNVSPPYEPERWGITIWPADKKFKREDVDYFAPDRYKPKNVLTQIIRVRDDEELEAVFELDKTSKIRIYAIGEITKDQLFDFGWIEKADTREVVWEMTYRKTVPAGGDEKNRMFNGTIILEAGRYVVVFRTDDSHSYRNWNADRPLDPENYGITIFLVE